MTKRHKLKSDQMKSLWEDWIATGKTNPEKKYFGPFNKNTFSIILIISLTLGITANIGIWLPLIWQ